MSEMCLNMWLNNQVRCTSIHSVITVSTVHNVFCQPLISSKKCPMNFDVIMFCSWTYNSTSQI